jgi:hypothetical protein
MADMNETKSAGTAAKRGGRRVGGMRATELAMGLFVDALTKKAMGGDFAAAQQALGIVEAVMAKTKPSRVK